MQSDAGKIDAADARNQGVTSFQLAVEDQLSQEHGSDPVARAIGAHVNRIFDRKAISIPGAELRCITKTNDIALEFRDQVWQTPIQYSLAPSTHFGFIRRDGFKCRGARRDEVSIDRGNIRYVCRS